jgi:hypothetical protein
MDCSLHFGQDSNFVEGAMSSIVSVLLIVVNVAIGFSIAEAKGKNIRGEVLYSFEEPHYLFQSGDFIFRLKKSELSLDNQKVLATVGSRAELQVPMDSIDLVWKAFDSESLKKYVSIRKDELTKQKIFRHKNGTLWITGVVMSPMEKSFLTMQAGNVFVRLHVDRAHLNSLEPDKIHAIKIPPTAIDFAWTADVRPSSRKKQPRQNQEEISALDGQVLIKGKLLHSFQEDVLIQSKDHVFQISAAGLSPLLLKKIKLYPLSVSVVIPPEAILMSWRIYSINEIENIRTKGKAIPTDL